MLVQINKDTGEKMTELNMKDRFKVHHATPLKAMRAFCIQCMGHQPGLVKGCKTESCPLYPYRMGHRPNKNSTLIGLTDAVTLSKMY